MKRYSVIVVIIILAAIIFIPSRTAFVFEQTRTEQPMMHYVLIDEDIAFQIRYTHSIHQTDVWEYYRITADDAIRFVQMTYDKTAIGMPATADKGQTLTLENGMYTLRFDDTVIDDFTVLIGDIDADLSFYYAGQQYDLKEQLQRGESYRFSIQHLSLYERVKGMML